MSNLTDAALTIEAEVIRDETQQYGNTKERVYQMFKDIIDSKSSLSSPRVQLLTTETAVVPNWDTDDMIDITALGSALSIANPSGTPSNGQQILFRIKDNGSAQSLSFGTAYAGTLPTITTVGEYLIFGIMYNVTTVKSDVIYNAGSSGGSGTTQFRGAFNATGTDVYPSSGGSGPAGAILAGDNWYISVSGTNTDYGGDVPLKAIYEALIDTPGSTAANWRIY